MVQEAYHYQKLPDSSPPLHPAAYHHLFNFFLFFVLFYIFIFFIFFIFFNIFYDGVTLGLGTDAQI